MLRHTLQRGDRDNDVTINSSHELRFLSFFETRILISSSNENVISEKFVNALILMLKRGLKIIM